MILETIPEGHTASIRAADLYLLASSARVRMALAEGRPLDKDHQRLLEQAIKNAQRSLEECGMEFRSRI